MAQNLCNGTKFMQMAGTQRKVKATVFSYLKKTLIMTEEPLV